MPQIAAAHLLRPETVCTSRRMLASKLVRSPQGTHIVESALRRDRRVIQDFPPHSKKPAGIASSGFLFFHA
jgi:hypothetical protein